MYLIFIGKMPEKSSSADGLKTKKVQFCVEKMAVDGLWKRGSFNRRLAPRFVTITAIL
jgi:hypothetical protein